MIARFQATGAVYERKKRRWLLSTPRHHAEKTSRPAPGNKILTRRMVNSRVSASKLFVNAMIQYGAVRMPISTITDVTSASRVSTAFATA